MSRRIERINHLLREEISNLLQREVKDPRLSGLVTITQVSTSSDLSHAKVSISIMEDDEGKKETLKALTQASGFFRKELSVRLKLRRVPELTFHQDDSISEGSHILDVITKISTHQAVY